MSPTLQTLLVGLLLLLAVGYIARRGWALLSCVRRTDASDPGCGSGCGCGPE